MNTRLTPNSGMFVCSSIVALFSLLVGIYQWIQREYPSNIREYETAQNVRVLLLVTSTTIVDVTNHAMFL